MAEAIELTESAFDETVATGVTIVDFWATWCGPCKVLSALIEQQVMPQLGEGVKFAKVDVGNEPGLAAQYEVLSIPAVLVFKDGEEQLRLDGMQKPDELIAAVKGVMG